MQKEAQFKSLENTERRQANAKAEERRDFRSWSSFSFGRLILSPGTER